MKFIATLMIALLFSASAVASPLPVEISAAKSLEWDRNAKTYTARKDVIVTQGETRLTSDKLTARYKDDKGAFDITTLEATGGVTISSAPYTAYGDKAVYNVQTGTAVLTGEDLKITTDADTLTAEDKIEFSADENKLSAIGKATATNGERTLTAERLDALFTKDENGKMAVSTITADGKITIKSGRETVTGDHGLYNVQTQKAVLTGKVKVSQGENWLSGTRAEVDMKTGVSRLSGEGNTATEGRVKGVFHPKPAKEAK